MVDPKDTALEKRPEALTHGGTMFSVGDVVRDRQSGALGVIIEVDNWISMESSSTLGFCMLMVRWDFGANFRYPSFEVEAMPFLTEVRHAANT